MADNCLSSNSKCPLASQVEMTVFWRGLPFKVLLCMGFKVTTYLGQLLEAFRCLWGILKQIVLKSIFIKNNKRSQLLFRLSVLKGNGMGYIRAVFIKTLYAWRTCLCAEVRSWPNVKVAATKWRQRCWAFTLLTVTLRAQEKGLWFLQKQLPRACHHGASGCDLRTLRRKLDRSHPTLY